MVPSKLLPVTMIATVLALTPLRAASSVLHVPGEHPTIQAGIDAAASGDTVEVACGTYFENGLLVYQRDIHVISETGSPECVIVDGEDLNSVITFQQTTSTLAGVTIRNGFASVGAGILIWDSSTVDIRDCVIRDNYATNSGGGLWITDSDVTLTFTAITGNHAQGGTFTAGGGGLRIQSTSNLVLQNCTVAGNTAPDGPGIKIAGSVPVVSLDRCIFANQDCPPRATVTCSCFRDCAVGGTNFQADPLFCDAASGDYRLAAGSPCLPDGNACASLIGSEPLGCGVTELVQAVITTAPVLTSIQVDGATFSAPAIFDWPLYSEHSVSADLVSLSPGERLRFDSWSDGGTGGHTIFVDSDSLLLVANFVRQLELTTAVSGSGSVTPSSGWFDEGDTVHVQATPAMAFQFDQWIGAGVGSYSGSQNPAAIVPASPISQHAVFDPIAYDFTISASATDPTRLVAAPANGLRNLYLWLTCANAGISALAAATSGTLVAHAFIPVGGVLNAGSASDLLLAVPLCPAGEEVSLLLGYWLVDDPGGTLCLAPGSTGELAAVDCNQFVAVAPRVAGFASDGSRPCGVGFDVCGFPHLPYSWPETDPGRWNAVRAQPNPFSDFTEILLGAEFGDPVRISIYDVTGRRVRSMESEELGDASRPLRWDGRSDSGRLLPSGVYFLRVDTTGSSVTRKVTRLQRR